MDQKNYVKKDYNLPKNLGLIDTNIIPHPIKTIRKSWDELTLLEKLKEIKIMQTYAAMVEILDENIGRLIDHLNSIDELNNTFILFMSDNGAEGMLMEALPLTNQKLINSSMNIMIIVYLILVIKIHLLIMVINGLKQQLLLMQCIKCGLLKEQLYVH